MHIKLEVMQQKIKHKSEIQPVNKPYWNSTHDVLKS